MIPQWACKLHFKHCYFTMPKQCSELLVSERSIWWFPKDNWVRTCRKLMFPVGLIMKRLLTNYQSVLEGIHFLIDLKALREQKVSEERLFFFLLRADRWTFFFPSRNIRKEHLVSWGCLVPQSICSYLPVSLEPQRAVRDLSHRMYWCSSPHSGNCILKK